MQYPKKSEQVYVEAIEQELCVYDWQGQKMHTLNPTAVLVWELCDGQTSPAAMAARLEQELDVPDANKLVWLSLDRLEKAVGRLLDEGGYGAVDPEGRPVKVDTLRKSRGSLLLRFFDPSASSLAG